MNIKFCHRYHKLDRPIFTTIRGKTWAEKIRNDQIVGIEAPKIRFEAVVVRIEKKLVSEMSLKFLQDDAEYPGFQINSVQDFIDLLNSFRAPSWQQVGLNSEMTVITLERI